MDRKRRLIPFRWLPGSWGLTGRIYAEAEANYYYDGEELEQRLAEIHYADDEVSRRERLLALDLKHGRVSAYQHDLKLLDIHGRTDDLSVAEVELRHGHIDQHTFDRRVVQRDKPEGIEREVSLLEVDHRHGKIDKNDFEKQKATLLEEPWIGIINQGFDPDHGVNGVYFEFDWNSFWIEYLRMNGYSGHTDEQIVEQWFSDVCRTISSAPEQTHRLTDDA